MINCGAICDVVDLLSHLSPEAYTYIIDSNRPVHLANVYPKRDRCLPLLFQQRDYVIRMGKKYVQQYINVNYSYIYQVPGILLRVIGVLPVRLLPSTPWTIAYLVLVLNMPTVNRVGYCISIPIAPFSSRKVKGIYTDII